MREPRVFYFGQYPGKPAGHSLYGPGGTHLNQYDLPVALAPHRLDGGFAPSTQELRPSQKEGVARTTIVGDFTVVSFWDRTGDSRPNSHSTFVVEGKHHMRNALAHCQRVFPEVFARIRSSRHPFTIVPLC